MGAVWDLDLPRNKTIILLAMADHADHNGNNIFPSIGLIAWKTGYSESQTRRIIQTLVKDGILVKTIRPGKTTNYRVDLSAGTMKKPYENKKVDQNKPDPVHSDDTPIDPCHNSDTPSTQMTPPVLSSDDTPTPSTQMTPEPSFEPSFEPSGEKSSIKAPEIIAAYKRAYPKDAQPIIGVKERTIAIDIAQNGYTPLEVEALTKQKLKEKDSYPLRFLREDLPGFRRKQPSHSTYRTMSPAEPDDPDKEIMPPDEAVKFLKEEKAKAEAARKDKAS